MKKHKVPFPWYGGKCSRLKWLLPLVNKIEHTTYVEPFGGSGALLFNKPISPVEVYNDIYGDVVNFLRVLRDHTEEIVNLLSLTPYSREEFEDAINIPEDLSYIERARKFFVRARQVRSGLATSCTVGNWSYSKSESRRGISQTVSRWLSSVDGLLEFVDRLKVIQIENLPAIDIINRYSSKDTLYYLDPPYMLETRSQEAYAHEMVHKDHERLLKFIKSIDGKFVLSGYSNELYDNLLSDWHILEFEENLGGFSKSESSKRIEKIWSSVPL